MRCAIITITPNGVSLAEKLAAAVDDAITIYGKKDRCPENTSTVIYEKMSLLVKHLFPYCDAIVFFCAIGIAVRMIAPYIVKKDKDPAIIVIDEQGHFAVSLLSGHLGGANELTKKFAGIINAVPVITTATDVNGLIAPDIIARQLGYSVKPVSKIKLFNTALLQGRPIYYYVDDSLPDASQCVDKLRDLSIDARSINKVTANIINKPAIMITDTYEQTDAAILYFIKHRLIAGIGCRRGVSQKHIEQCLKKACAIINYSINDITLISSARIKANETGILQTAAKYTVPVKFWPNTVLQQTILDYKLSQSPFVKQQIGIGNVCEAAALAGSSCKKLVLTKTKFEKVTVALAWEK
ncbi:cobalt-precorrin 5A hydrolase [Pectinatus frisingensis]|uniref:cobalt-precorrin 5A hydrolase n=1 Tax=Pectinatus frisingensis TaxID=865 RepID=UPI0018C767FF|nr:cobalt-precorrin 5A hydrolase [Pectinatus frisingensis]